MDQGFNTSEDPKYTSALGAVILLDNLFRFASGYLINNDAEGYYNTLEAIYLEIYSWMDKKAKSNVDKQVTEERVEMIEILRKKSINGNWQILKEYHKELNSMANDVGLRMKNSENLPGVLRGH